MSGRSCAMRSRVLRAGSSAYIRPLAMFGRRASSRGGRTSRAFLHGGPAKGSHGKDPRRAFPPNCRPPLFPDHHAGCPPPLHDPHPIRSRAPCAPRMKAMNPPETPVPLLNPKPVPKDSSLDPHELLSALEAVRGGDFSVRLPGDRVGLAGKIADTFNDIVASNRRMAHELERVGELVGREGRTRQRVSLERSGGAWGEMEESINGLIEDLIWPTREVQNVISAVARGDLLQSVRLDVDGRPLKGEFLRSATIVNKMIQQLAVFTSEVTRVAREVGSDGKLGGQAVVPGVAGTWKDLTDSVNSMAN